MRADGTVLADGAATDLAGLDARLTKLEADRGEVWYYREHPEREPHPVALNVMDLITKHKVRLSMSTKADFSYYVDADGTTHPRK